MSEDRKYTLSFINGQPGLVIKVDNSKEAENAIAKIFPVFKRFRDAIDNGVEKTKSAPIAPKQPRLVVTCEAHGIQMASGISRKTNNEYWYHDVPNQGRCFGKGVVSR